MKEKRGYASRFSQVLQLAGSYWGWLPGRGGTGRKAFNGGDSVVRGGGGEGGLSAFFVFFLEDGGEGGCGVLDLFWGGGAVFLGAGGAGFSGEGCGGGFLSGAIGYVLGGVLALDAKARGGGDGICAGTEEEEFPSIFFGLMADAL